MRGSVLIGEDHRFVVRNRSGPGDGAKTFRSAMTAAGT